MRKNVWGKNYHGLEIRSDYRVHEVVFSIMEEFISTKTEVGGQRCSILDIATGSGALAKKIKDKYVNSDVDINDFESQSGFADFKNKYSVDLNLDFSNQFSKIKYDIILAVEIIEHLENPWNFFREVKRLLKDDGLLIVSTPNTDSLLDRVWFLLYGYEFYFGRNGYDQSGGHISPIPNWKMQLMTDNAGLIISKQNKSINIWPHIGKLTLFKLMLFGGVGLIFSKNKNDVSINVFSITRLVKS